MRKLLLLHFLVFSLMSCKKDPPVTVQEHINAGYNIADLRDLFPDDSLYGKDYQGGYIFYLTAQNEALVVSKTDINSSNEWGCQGQDIPGASSTAFGNGSINSEAIQQGCTNPASAAGNCFYANLENQTDWYLPTSKELEEIHNTLQLDGMNFFETSDQFWSSTQQDASNALFFDFAIGAITDTNKAALIQTRGVRKSL